MCKFDVPLKLTIYAKDLSDEFVDKLINISISHTNGSQSSKRIKLLFDTACRNEFHVKGFRSASAASATSLVKKPLVDLIRRSKNIVWAIVKVWLEARLETQVIC